MTLRRTLVPSGRIAGLVLASLTLILSACGSGGDGPSSSTTGPSTNTDVVAGVRISPSTATVTVGSSVDFSATTVRSDGTVIGTATGVAWSVSDASKGSVTSAGRYTALATGNVYVNATLSTGQASQAQVTNTTAGGGGGGGGATVASVSVSPNGAALFTGGTQQFTATAKDASGATLSGQTFTWSSSATGVATVNASGLMTAVGAGAVTITATSVSNTTKSGSASVTVSVQPSGSGTALTSGTAVPSLSGAAGDARLYRIDVPSGATNLNVQTTGGTGDVDLYVRSGQAPTFSVYTCKSTNPATAEQCQVTSPAAGTWYILVQGFAAYSGVSLTATVTTSGGGGGGGGGAAGSVARVSVGGTNVCAVTTTGAGYCWGTGSSGVVANGQAISSTTWYTPVPVIGNHTWRQIEVGTSFACGVTTSDELYCWGRNTSYGELGIGSTASTNFTTPQRVGAGMSFSTVTTGNTHSCALTTSGAAYCWGQNDASQLGDGVTMNSPLVRSSPYAVAGGYTYTSIAAAGNRNTCAVRTGGTILCWGDGQGGRLGRPYVLSNGDLSNRTPTPVSFAFTATSVAAGNSHFCAVGADGSIACWGLAQAGQLGRAGTTGESTYVPNIVTAAVFTGVGGGLSHTCARAATNAIWCWGYNGVGQLGDGTTTNRPTPAAISGLSFKQVAVGFETACGITTTDALYCWGGGSYGVLGQGTYVGYSTVPLQVRFP